jgi:glycosyltransferase involved in cell wall biosynthesis
MSGTASSPAAQTVAASEPITVVIDATAIHATSGGAGTYLRALIRALPTVGVLPIVIARRNDDSEWIGAAAVHRIAPAKRPLRLLWEQFGLVRAVKRTVADGVVILHSPHYTAPLRCPARIKQVVTVHDLTMFSRPDDHDWTKRLLFQWAVKRSSRAAEVIVAVSHTTADAYSAVTGRSERIVVAPHGVDHERFHPSTSEAQRAADADLLAKAGVQSPYIVHLGTIEPRKQVPLLVEAFRAMRIHFPEMHLVLAGQIWPGMKARLGKPDVNEQHLGYVPDDLAVALLRCAAAVAYPSNEEGFGLPLLEGLACGTPVVATASAISQEVCGDAANLVPVHPESTRVTRLASVLGDVVRNSQPNSLAGVQRAQGFNWQKCAGDHLRAYLMALNS